MGPMGCRDPKGIVLHQHPFKFLARGRKEGRAQKQRRQHSSRLCRGPGAEG
jgi:hypothetical protein